MVAFYLGLTRALGSQRRLIRRIAALCLVFMGVHLAADHLDDIAYAVIDTVDLAVDNTVAGFFDWLAQHGGMSSEAALKSSAAFASFVDLAEKDKLALVIALASELLLDLMLFALAWGRHVDEDAAGLVAELRTSVMQMRDALLPLDLERLAVLPTLLAFAVGGALMSALAIENIARDLLQRVAPDFNWAGQSAAALGILAAALLAWRFFPDLLHGALLRSRSRHDSARARFDAAMRGKTKLRRALGFARLYSRGLWLVVIALPLAVSALLSHDLLALAARVELIP